MAGKRFWSRQIGPKLLKEKNDLYLDYGNILNLCLHLILGKNGFLQLWWRCFQETVSEIDRWGLVVSSVGSSYLTVRYKHTSGKSGYPHDKDAWEGEIWHQLLINAKDALSVSLARTASPKDGVLQLVLRFLRLYTKNSLTC